MTRNEIRKIVEAAEMEHKTAEFLSKQADELLPMLDDPNLSYQEKEEVALRLETLLGKIRFELKDAEQRI